MPCPSVGGGGGGEGGELLYKELRGTRRTSSLGVKKAGFWNLTSVSTKEEGAFTVSKLYSDTISFVFVTSLSEGMA